MKAAAITAIVDARTDIQHHQLVLPKILIQPAGVYQCWRLSCGVGQRPRQKKNDCQEARHKITCLWMLLG